MSEVGVAILLIRLGVGLTMIAFGVSQFVNPKGWIGYLPGWMQKLMPMKPTSFMREHAVGNFILGLLFVIGIWPVVIAWCVALWWLSILPFALRYDRYIGLRDGAIILAVVAVILLHHA